jgi:DNA-binding SARP family transcriptional activator/tetratricopeptide (TPR) repeat protein
MRFRVLGPLRALGPAGWTTVPAPQQRVLLAVLLAEAGQVVSTGRMVDELWARPPRRAVATVQVYLGRLRRLLGPGAVGRLVTHGSGYRLLVDDGDVDADVFERLVAAARDALAAGRPQAAVDTFAEALSLWHGPALADVPASATVTALAARLERARLGAVEDAIGVRLDLGRHLDVVDELGSLVGDHPLRERLHAFHVLALYRCGRRGEALAAYQAARRTLLDELGLEPGPELRGIERAILADERQPAVPPVHLDAPAAHPSVPAQLPAAVAEFTGRAGQLKRLDTLLDRGGSRRPVMVIGAVAGAAGVGKTALAVRWAHQHRDRFPDGQLYVNLRGYAAERPLRPVDALAMFLPALGVAAEQVPADQEEAAAVFRSLLADKRMLVLLDNANHADQVRPLLPGGAGCLVLVTSRDRLDGLVARDGAARLDVDVLTDEEARTLLVRLLGPERAEAEPAATTDLVRLCGRLPLALRIVAANLAKQPGAGLGDYAAHLSKHDRLTMLAVDGDPQAAVRTAVDYSYEQLTPAVRRVFRLIGLVPSPDVTVESVAALADTDAGTAAASLDRLAAVHLIEETRPGRYAYHDLVRIYAAERATVDERPSRRDGALRRLYDFYLCRVHAAAARLYPEMTRLPVPGTDIAEVTGFADHTRALEWLDAERANLVAAVRHAAMHGPRSAAWRLADAMRGYLLLGMHIVEWATVAAAAREAADADGDDHARAAAHISLAGWDWATGRYRQAIDRYAPALAFARRAGWAAGESTVLGNLANVHAEQGQLTRAAEYLAQALDIDRRHRDRGAQAIKLGNLGTLYRALGQLRQAVRCHTEALDLHRQFADRSGEAYTLTSLGEAYQELGQLSAAATALTRAVALNREVADRATEADALHVLARVHRDRGRYDEALDLAREALALARDAGRSRTEGDALNTEASIHLEAGRAQQAVDGYQRALATARTWGHRHAEAEALIGLATAHHRATRTEQAVAHARDGLLIAQDGRYRLLEGDALTTLAAIHLRLGESQAALDHASRGIDVHSETGHRLGLARARIIAARALQRIGRIEAAGSHRRRAEELFAEIGAPVPDYRHG